MIKNVLININRLKKKHLSLNYQKKRVNNLTNKIIQLFKKGKDLPAREHYGIEFIQVKNCVDNWNQEEI